MVLRDIDASQVRDLLPCFLVGIGRPWRERPLTVDVACPDWIHRLLHQAGGYSCDALEFWGTVYPLRLTADADIAERLLPIIGSSASWDSVGQTYSKTRSGSRHSASGFKLPDSAYGGRLNAVQLGALLEALDPSGGAPIPVCGLEACLQFSLHDSFGFLEEWSSAKIVDSGADGEFDLEPLPCLVGQDQWWQVLAVDPDQDARALGVWLLWENRD